MTFTRLQSARGGTDRTRVSVTFLHILPFTPTEQGGKGVRLSSPASLSRLPFSQ